MKRPRIIYLVAAWCFLGLLMEISILTRPGRAYEVAGQAVPVLWTVLPIVAFGFMIWQTVGLIRLRRFQRWFATVFFCWWGVALVWNATFALRAPTVKFFPALTVFCTLIAFNLLSAWYLSRRSFREFAVRFVAEREEARRSRMMQKASLKKTRAGIGG